MCFSLPADGIRARMRGYHPANHSQAHFPPDYVESTRRDLQRFNFFNEWLTVDRALTNAL
jgi:hypothetical protein